MYLCLAPMDGITTYATRKLTLEIFEKYGKKSDALQVWTEFMNVDGFLINPRKVIKHLLTDTTQKPIAQIYGGNPDTLLEAAKIIQTNYSEVFSGIELNTGCPSNTVMKVGGGSDMMNNRAKTLEIIKQLSETTKIGGLPFSMKARAGVNEEDKKEQADFLLEASTYCSKISIHGRTLKQLYSWEADWDFIQQIKQRIFCNNEDSTTSQNPPYPPLQKGARVIGNGGITSYEQAQHYYGCYQVDGIMIGQAAIGNPWIFTPHLPSHEEKLNTILRHLELTVASDQIFEQRHCEENICITPDELAYQIKTNNDHPDFSPHSLVEFRKFLFQYIKGIPGSREWKQEMLQVKKYGELRKEIVDFFS